MCQNQDKYVPALGYNWLTRVYDPVVRLTTRENTFKAALLQQARIEDSHRVLDLGCGTATLTIAIKLAHPKAEVVGLDGDPVVLEKGSTKAQIAGARIIFDKGLSYQMPYPDNSFDRVVSSLVFHHLTREKKLRTLGEVWRVLKPGGELHIGDWGGAQNMLLRLAFLAVQLLDGFETTTDNVNGLLPRFMNETGFQGVEETRRYTTMLGTLSLYRAHKPVA